MARKEGRRGSVPWSRHCVPRVSGCVASRTGIRTVLDPQQAPVRGVEQYERRGEYYATHLVDPDGNLLGRGGQATVHMPLWLFGYLEFDFAHCFHFHRVRQFRVQFRRGVLRGMDSQSSLVDL